MPTPGTPSAYRSQFLTLQGADGEILELVDGRVPVVPTDASGVPLFSPPLGQYSLALIMRQTTALAIGSTVWAMHNPPAPTGTKTVHLRHLRITQSFDGVVAAQTTLSYSLSRFAGTSVDTGTGLASPTKWRTAYPASVIYAKVDGGTAITGTGIVYEAAFAHCSLSLVENVGAFPATASYTAPNILHEFTFGDNGTTFGGFELAPGEGLGIRVTSVPTIIGSFLSGYLEWDER